MVVSQLVSLEEAVVQRMSTKLWDIMENTSNPLYKQSVEQLLQQADATLENWTELVLHTDNSAQDLYYYPTFPSCTHTPRSICTSSLYAHLPMMHPV